MTPQPNIEMASVDVPEKTPAPMFTLLRTGTRVEGQDSNHEEPSVSERRNTARRQFDSYRALVARTVDVFGDEIKAARWLSSPSVDFSGRTPIQAAEDVDYAKEELEQLFEPIFVHIEEGIY